MQPWDDADDHTARDHTTDADARSSGPDSWDQANSWDQAKRPKPGWGCAVAAIVGSIATVVAVIIVAKLLASLINTGDLSP